MTSSESEFEFVTEKTEEGKEVGNSAVVKFSEDLNGSVAKPLFSFEIIEMMPRKKEKKNTSTTHATTTATTHATTTTNEMLTLKCRDLGMVRFYVKVPRIRSLLLIEMIGRVVKNLVRFDVEKLRKKYLFTVNSTSHMHVHTQEQEEEEMRFRRCYLELVVYYFNVCLGENDVSLYFWKHLLPFLIEKKFPLALTNEEKQEEFDLRSHLLLFSLWRTLQFYTGISFKPEVETKLTLNKPLSNEHLLQIDDIRKIKSRLDNVKVANEESEPTSFLFLSSSSSSPSSSHAAATKGDNAAVQVDDDWNVNSFASLNLENQKRIVSLFPTNAMTVSFISATDLEDSLPPTCTSTRRKVTKTNHDDNIDDDVGDDDADKVKEEEDADDDDNDDNHVDELIELLHSTITPIPIRVPQGTNNNKNKNKNKKKNKKNDDGDDDDADVVVNTSLLGMEVEMKDMTNKDGGHDDGDDDDDDDDDDEKNNRSSWVMVENQPIVADELRTGDNNDEPEIVEEEDVVIVNKSKEQDGGMHEFYKNDKVSVLKRKWQVFHHNSLNSFKKLFE